LRAAAAILAAAADPYRCLQLVFSPKTDHHADTLLLRFQLQLTAAAAAYGSSLLQSTVDQNAAVAAAIACTLQLADACAMTATTSTRSPVPSHCISRDIQTRQDSTVLAEPQTECELHTSVQVTLRLCYCHG
jgi:hypothetical protein